MLVVPLIERKRDGGALTPEEWSALVAAYTADRIPDYQMSALLMAVLLRGLERQELAALTDAMLASGQRLAFDSWATPRVDKHSTGGVGDKVSLVLAPLVAACVRGRADDVGARAGPHRRHARQARGDPRVPDRTVARRGEGPGDEARLRDDRPDARDRPGRPPDLRAARRHRHRRRDSADRGQHHVEEARRGAERARARREAGERRVPPQARAESRARGDDDRAGRGPRLPHRRAAHGH